MGSPRTRAQWASIKQRIGRVGRWTSLFRCVRRRSPLPQPIYCSKSRASQLQGTLLSYNFADKFTQSAYPTRLSLIDRRPSITSPRAGLCESRKRRTTVRRRRAGRFPTLLSEFIVVMNSPTMRRFVALGLLVLATTFVTGSEELVRAQTWYQQAERREVRLPQAVVFSGPAKRDYSCGKLDEGTVVEVYGRSDNGRIAIRPPRGSFSWVLADSVARTRTKNVYQVVSERSIVWIGSSLATPPHYQWQVELSQGDKVVAIEEGRIERAPVDGAPSWLKIEPPAGEFRWIDAEAVEPIATAESRRWAEPISRPSFRGAGVRTVGFETTADSSFLDSRGGDSPPRMREPADAVPIQPSATSDADLLTALKAELTGELARPERQWSLAPLLSRAERLTQSADSEIRREALKVESEIIRLGQLQQRASRLESPLALAGFTPGGIDEQAKLDKPEFDGAGYLLPVHSSRRGVPPFALVDQRNEVVCLVRPAPGLRLHRYANQRIGVYGKRREQAGAPVLLTAERVVVLDDRQR